MTSAELQFSAVFRSYRVLALLDAGSADSVVHTTSVATTTRGFILQATYRVTGPDEARVPVVYLYGRLEDGSTFRVRDDRRRPCFYIRSTDTEAAARLGAPAPAPTDRKTFGGSPVARIEVAAPSDVPPLRDRLHAAGIDTFEADVRFASRYLIERGIKGGCEIAGDAVRGAGGIAWTFHNPALTPASVTLEPRVLSFDIETDPEATRLLAISLYAPGVDEVLIVDPQGRAMPPRATRCADEKAALDAFCHRVAAFDPDVLT